MIYSKKLHDEYLALKATIPADCLLLMQSGVFMQAYGADARAVSAATGAQLKVGGAAEAPVEMCGFPKSGLDAYAGRLLRAGKSLAIAHQGEDKRRVVSETIQTTNH